MEFCIRFETPADVYLLFLLRFYKDLSIFTTYHFLPSPAVGLRCGSLFVSTPGPSFPDINAFAVFYSFTRPSNAAIVYTKRSDHWQKFKTPREKIAVTVLTSKGRLKSRETLTNWPEWVRVFCKIWSETFPSIRTNCTFPNNLKTVART